VRTRHRPATEVPGLSAARMRLSSRMASRRLTSRSHSSHCIESVNQEPNDSGSTRRALPEFGLRPAINFEVRKDPYAQTSAFGGHHRLDQVLDRLLG